MESSISVPAFVMSLETAITLITYLVAAAYCVFTGIFYYHWNEYSTDSRVTGYTLIAYFATTIPLLLVMGIVTFILNQ